MQIQYRCYAPPTLAFYITGNDAFIIVFGFHCHFVFKLVNAWSLQECVRFDAMEVFQVCVCVGHPHLHRENSSPLRKGTQGPPGGPSKIQELLRGPRSSRPRRPPGSVQEAPRRLQEPQEASGGPSSLAGGPRRPPAAPEGFRAPLVSQNTDQACLHLNFGFARFSQISENQEKSFANLYVPV